MQNDTQPSGIMKTNTRKVAYAVVLVAIGGLFGFMFMWPTIAMEGTDAFDAISRAFNYVLARPWKTFWCSLMATLYGIAVIGFVGGFTWLVLRIAGASVALGMGSERFGPIGQFVTGWHSAGPVSWPTLIAMILMRGVIIIAWGLVLGFAVSYKVTACTLVYAVLRRDVDGTDMAEVYLPEPDEEEADLAAGREDLPETTSEPAGAKPPESTGENEPPEER